MEGTTRIEEAKLFFGQNFIGSEGLQKLKLSPPELLPDFPFDMEVLKKKINPENYLLVLSVTRFEDNSPVNILEFRKKFGINPEQSEPCLYNQDWYLKEKFVTKNLECKWNLLSKKVLDDSRGQQPNILTQSHIFPSAILCMYVFFIVWFHTGEILWKNDYVWCNDQDNNGDRIYVGGYQSLLGLNKNGFEIHRHLSIKNIYGAIDNIV